MNLLDMRTVMLAYVLSNTICAAVIVSVWSTNHKRYKGMGFWLADYIMELSIGIALYPEHGSDFDGLLKEADKAMYKVKNSTKNGYAFAEATK